MPLYEVEIKITKKIEKPLQINARDAAEAEEKAVDIALAWGDDITDAEACVTDEF